MSTTTSAIIVIRFLIAALCLTYLLSLTKARHLSAMTWDQLLLRLHPIDGQEIRSVAYDLCFGSGTPTQKNCGRLYSEIGGAEGITRLKQNAEILIMLAAYTEVWSPGASAATVRRMREDGFRLKQAAWKMALTSFLRYPNAKTALFVQEISRSYYSMIDELLALYASVNIARYTPLQAACGML